MQIWSIESQTYIYILRDIASSFTSCLSSTCMLLLVALAYEVAERDLQKPENKNLKRNIQCLAVNELLIKGTATDSAETISEG